MGVDQSEATSTASSSTSQINAAILPLLGPSLLCSTTSRWDADRRIKAAGDEGHAAGEMRRIGRARAAEIVSWYEAEAVAFSSRICPERADVGGVGEMTGETQSAFQQGARQGCRCVNADSLSSDRLPSW